MHLSFMSGSLVPCSSCLIHSSVSLLCFFSFVQPAIRFVCLVGCHRGLEIVVNINDLHWVFHPNFFHLPWFPVAPASPSSSVFIAYVNRQGCLLRLVGIQEYANANDSHWCSFLSSCHLLLCPVARPSTFALFFLLLLHPAGWLLASHQVFAVVVNADVNMNDHHWCSFQDLCHLLWHPLNPGSYFSRFLDTGRLVITCYWGLTMVVNVGDLHRWSFGALLDLLWCPRAPP